MTHRDTVFDQVARLEDQGIEEALALRFATDRDAAIKMVNRLQAWIATSIWNPDPKAKKTPRVPAAYRKLAIEMTKDLAVETRENCTYTPGKWTATQSVKYFIGGCMRKVAGELRWDAKVAREDNDWASSKEVEKQIRDLHKAGQSILEIVAATGENYDDVQAVVEGRPRVVSGGPLEMFFAKPYEDGPEAIETQRSTWLAVKRVVAGVKLSKKERRVMNHLIGNALRRMDDQPIVVESEIGSRTVYSLSKKLHEPLAAIGLTFEDVVRVGDKDAREDWTFAPGGALQYHKGVGAESDDGGNARKFFEEQLGGVFRRTEEGRDPAELTQVFDADVAWGEKRSYSTIGDGGAIWREHKSDRSLRTMDKGTGKSALPLGQLGHSADTDEFTNDESGE